MPHARQQIRDYVAGSVLASLVATTTIYKTRQFPKTAFPFIAVYTLRERLTVENPGYLNSEKRYRRQLQLAIDVGVDSGDNAVDTLCSTIETLMAADESMGGGVISADLTATDILPVQEADKAIHQARMTFEITYRTSAADPTVLLA